MDGTARSSRMQPTVMLLPKATQLAAPALCPSAITAIAENLGQVTVELPEPMLVAAETYDRATYARGTACHVGVPGEWTTDSPASNTRVMAQVQIVIGS